MGGPVGERGSFDLILDNSSGSSKGRNSAKIKEVLFYAGFHLFRAVVSAALLTIPIFSASSVKLNAVVEDFVPLWPALTETAASRGVASRRGGLLNRRHRHRRRLRRGWLLLRRLKGSCENDDLNGDDGDNFNGDGDDYDEVS